MYGRTQFQLGCRKHIIENKRKTFTKTGNKVFMESKLIKNYLSTNPLNFPLFITPNERADSICNNSVTENIVKVILGIQSERKESSVFNTGQLLESFQPTENLRNGINFSYQHPVI